MNYMRNKFTALQQKLNANHKKIISNIVWLIFDRTLSAGVSFFMGIWLARYLGVEQYGTFRYVIAFAYIFSPLGTLGTRGIITRDLVENPSSKNELLGTTSIMRLIGGFCAASLAIGSTLIIEKENTSIWLLVAIISSTFFFQPLTVVEQWFESRVESKYIVYSRNLTLVFLSTLRIVFIINKAPLIIFIILLALDAIFYSLTLLLIYQIKYQNIQLWKVKFNQVKYLLKESFPLLLTGIMVTLYLKIDQVMLGQMADKKTVGIYAVAATLSEIWYMIPVAFTSSLFPAIVNSKKLSTEAYEKRLQNFYDLMALLAYIIIIVFVSISHDLIVTAYGQEYAPAVNILSIYILNCLFTFLGIAQSAWIISEGLQEFNFYATATGAVINIFLNLILIPKFQGIGAALATLVSYAFASYFIFLLIPQTRKNAILMTKAILLPTRIPKYVFRKNNIFKKNYHEK